MAFHPLSLILLTENQLPLYREYSSHQTRIHLISFFTQTNLHLYPSLSLSFCLRPTSSLMSLIPSSSTPQGHHLHIQSPSLHWLLIVLPPPFCLPANYHPHSSHSWLSLSPQSTVMWLFLLHFINFSLMPPSSVFILHPMYDSITHSTNI